MKNELTILVEKFLRRQASAGEISRLKALLMQAEAEDMLSGLYDEKWEQATFAPEKEVEARIWLKLQQQIAPESVIPLPEERLLPGERPLWKKALRVAASILIPLLCVGLGYFFAENKSAEHGGEVTVQVGVGQKAKLQLPDGTWVWLNSASSLACDKAYNKKERVIYLKGEAYFEVSKDKARPFVVKTSDVSIEALGTHFDVKAYPGDGYATATLMEGSIRVSSPFRSEVLAPNEKLTFTKSTGMLVKSELMDAEKNASWVSNQLAFEQERLEDIARVLERMYNIRVHFTSVKLKDIRFSGTIKNSNLDNVLQLIAFTSPIRYSLESDTAVVIRDR
jgi:ferric-dicitrate binding protein FerR (iron transport regulator)